MTVSRSGHTPYKLARASNSALFLESPGAFLSPAVLTVCIFPLILLLASSWHPDVQRCDRQWLLKLEAKVYLEFCCFLKDVCAVHNFVYSFGCRLIKQQEKIAETISNPGREEC